MSTVYLDGRLLREERARIPATDPALSWGVGLFEVARGYWQRAFLLDEHLARLRRSAGHFGIAADLPDLAPVVTRLFEANGLDGGRIRITLTGGGHLIVAVHAHRELPRRLFLRGAAWSVAPFRRDPRAPLAGHKTLNYLENMRARWDAEDQGVLDALVLGFRGEVLEGTRCNIFAVERGRLVTPPVGEGILPGVTRQLVLELAQRQGIEVRERQLRLGRLLEAEEVFVTSTMMEIVPVSRIDGRPVEGPGPLTRELRKVYRRRVRRECRGSEVTR